MYIEYNGYTLSYPRITSWTTEPFYDESGINVVTHRSVLRVQFWVVGDSQFDMRNKLNLVRESLMIPRRRLIVRDTSTGNRFVDIGFNFVNHPVYGNKGASKDLETGPKPAGIQIVEGVPGDKACLVEWGITYSQLECWFYEASENGNVIGDNRGHLDIVLSKSRKVSYTFDQQGLQTRTFVCTLTVRDDLWDDNGDLSEADVSALSTARIEGCIPRVPQGFRRLGVSINLSADGLKIRVETVDQEMIQPWFKGVAEIISQNLTETAQSAGFRITPSVPPIVKQFSLIVRGTKGTSREWLINNVMTPMIDSHFKIIPFTRSLLRKVNQKDERVEAVGREGDIIHNVVWTRDFTHNLIGVVITAQSFPKDKSVIMEFEDAESVSLYLTPGFRKESLPADAVVVPRDDDEEGVDYVTETPSLDGEDPLERFDNISPVTRLIVNSICREAHELLPSDPRDSSQVDDLDETNLTIKVNVDVGIPDTQKPRKDEGYKDTAGFSDGGYVEDKEVVRVERKVDVQGYGAFSIVPPAMVRAFQNSAPGLFIQQMGFAARVGARANPREMLRFNINQTETIKTIIRRKDIKYATPMLWAGRLLYVTTWNIVQELIFDGESDFTESDRTPGIITQVMQSQSAKNGRIMMDDDEEPNQALPQWDPDRDLSDDDDIGFPH